MEVLPNKAKNIDTSENEYYEFKDGVLYTADFKELVFALYNITNVNIDERVEVIKASAFRYCSSLPSINIPAKVKTIEGKALVNNNLSKITVSDGNNYFSVDERFNLYNKDKTKLIRNFDTGNITIREGVKNIGSGAFINDGKITGITLPESFEGDTTTGWEVFPTIDYIKIPKNVKTIDKYAYLNIKNIEISSDNQYLNLINNEYVLSEDGTLLYWVKSDLTSVNILNTVKTIKNHALADVKAEEIILPESIEVIGTEIGMNSTIKKIEIQSKIKRIDQKAFAGSKMLSEIIIHKQAGSITGSPWGCVIGDKAVQWVGE